MTMGSDDFHHVIPNDVIALTCRLKNFACENIKTTRRYLKRLDKSIVIDELKLMEFNKNSGIKEAQEVIKILASGEDVGIMSEAGCPGVADPGNTIVALAHEKGFFVKPHVGPNSILLTLMASGLNGQHFAFLGYAPIDKHEKAKWVQDMWKKVQRDDQTQLFMETPYRNNAMFEILLQQLPNQAMLSIGADLTTEGEKCKTLSVGDWKKTPFNYHKIPLIFAVGKDSKLN